MHDTDRTMMEMRPDFEAGEEEWLEFAPGMGFESEEEAGELDELTYELLGVQSEEELDQFIGSLVKRAAGAVRDFAKSSAGRAIGGVLKGAAKKLLPVAGTAIGGFFGGPAGASIGGKLGGFASGLFEGENFEEQEQSARQFVKMAQAAVKTAAQNAQSGPPLQVARQAVLQAAKTHAPQLLAAAKGQAAGAGAASSSSGIGATGGSGRQGRWIRHGRKIIILGV
jgi:uncharacterized protein (DUF697 family)